MSESSLRRTVAAVELECVAGDIAAQEGFDAVVNAANAHLETGGGVAGAIHRAAGPGLAEEARLFAPIRPGEAVVTSGHALPNRWVIHCLGPRYGIDEPAQELLRSCYREALARAEEHAMTSVAFPSISTGAFGYPLQEAAATALETVVSMAPTLQSVRRIRFVLWDREALEAHMRALDQALLGRG